jgi:hypothetical protein
MMAIQLDDPFLFAMYSVEAFLDFELLVFFLLRWKPQKTRHVAILGLAYLCFGIARILLMYWDYNSIGQVNETARLYITAAFFAFLAMSVFLHAAESLIKKTRHWFTIGFLGLSITILFFPNDLYNTVQMIYYIFAPVLILFVVIFLFYLMSMTTGAVRKKFFVVFIGLVLYGTGYALSARIFNIPEAISEATVLTGLVFTALGFIEIPMLEEIHWHDYLLHVFTFHIDSSACIHDERLVKTNQDEMVSADLFSSGVTGVIGIIKEMIQSEKKLKVLDHEDKKILLEYGKYVTVALVTRKDLDILHGKLRAYISRVETELGPLFEKWRGEVTRFVDPMKAITNDIFKTIIDKNWWRIDPKNVARQLRAFIILFAPASIIKRFSARRYQAKDPEFTPEARASVDVPRPADDVITPENDPWPAPERAKRLADQKGQDLIDTQAKPPSSPSQLNRIAKPATRGERVKRPESGSEVAAPSTLDDSGQNGDTKPNKLPSGKKLK